MTEQTETPSELVDAAAMPIVACAGTPGFTSPAVPEVGVGAQPLAVAVGDFTGDLKQDFAATNKGGNVSIRLGDGAGGFTSPAVP